MINYRFSCRLYLLTTILCGLGLGCSSTGGLKRSAQEPKLRTIASIGDRPVGSVAGTPTSSAVADLDLPGPRTEGEGRVSGRVVDAHGDPVHDARVRVADGGRPGGRLVEAMTDKAGGFTLHGLRSGSSYTLVAEYEGQGGLVTGRSQVRSPDADVEIALLTDDRPRDRKRASLPPSSRTISDRIELGEPTDGDGHRPSRLNYEDLPPADEVGEFDDAPAETSSRRSSNVVPVSNSGWRPAGARTAVASTPTPIGDRAARRASNQFDDLDSQPRTRRDVPLGGPAGPPGDEYEEGINPLPPAIERDVSSPTSVDPPGRSDEVSELSGDLQPSKLLNRQSPGQSPGALTLAAKGIAVSRSTTPPRMTKRAEKAEVSSVEGELPPTPFSLPTPEDPRLHQPAENVEVGNDPFRSKVEATSSTTWADLGNAWREDPPDLAERTTRNPTNDAPLGVEERQKPKAKGAEVETCRYDAKRRQIVDFRLPDLDGNLVSLKDFDSDLILIDFWGTWCRPCLGSIPHLVELQKRMGPRKLSIVGIACEDGPASSTAKHVAEVAERLNINYSVLLSSREASSPLQEALSIQVFPTMILLDREGRIVWRDQGALPITLARLDRVLESSSRVAENKTERSRR